MVRVRLDHVSKYFGRVRAVDDIYLEVAHGEFVTLLGPSGCGKTTTLLMIAGIYKPTKGRIYFDDVDVTDIPPKDRNVGMVFQSYALYPHMTVYENIAFPLRIKKLPKNEIDRKVREVARLLKIDHLLDRRPAQLSGGQQQRVALARALAKEPDVLLLDEPLSNLDALLRVYMRAELKRLQKELGITTIYVTHDQVEALSMSDRVVVMNEGKIQQVGTPEEIYAKPANVFVASFIGTPPMNIVRCLYSEESNSLRCPGFTYRLPKQWRELLAERRSDEILLGVRPEDVAILEPGTALEPHARAEVLVVEPLGRDIVITVALDEETTMKIVARPGTRVGVGERIGLRFEPEKIHLFDGRTGQALL